MARLFRTKEEGKKSLWDRIVDVALTDVTVLVKGLDEGSLEGLEETLIAADFGVPSTLRLVEVVETLAERGVATSQRDFLRAVREEIVAILRAGRSDTALRFNYEGGPTVFLVVGVNGVGKTTTIAKLAHRLTRQGRKVMIAAGDTFRAGAIEQLKRWAERVGVRVRGQRSGPRPRRRRLRRDGAGGGEGDRRADHRHRRPPAHAERPDEGAGEGAARRRQEAGGRAARDADRPGHAPSARTRWRRSAPSARRCRSPASC